MCLCIEDAIFGTQAVIAVTMEVLVHVDGFPVHKSSKCVIGSQGN